MHPLKWMEAKRGGDPGGVAFIPSVGGRARDRGSRRRACDCGLQLVVSFFLQWRAPWWRCAITLIHGNFVAHITTVPYGTSSYISLTPLPWISVIAQATKRSIRPFQLGRYPTSPRREGGKIQGAASNGLLQDSNSN